LREDGVARGLAVDWLVVEEEADWAAAPGSRRVIRGTDKERISAQSRHDSRIRLAEWNDACCCM
jgi:hypothetical protein